MALSEPQAKEWVEELVEIRNKESERLDVLRKYWRGKQPGPIKIPTGSPREIRHLVDMSRINIVALPVDVIGQALFVDGYRQSDSNVNEPVWAAWQANKMDARQTPVHRAAIAYGASYCTVLPGDPVPVIRGRSPRQLTVAYAGDDDWPAYALERRRGLRGKITWRLLDEQAVYTFSEDLREARGGRELVKTEEHDFGVCPVVRFRNTGDLDEEDEVIGEIAPLMPLQDQMDFTTFGLLVTQHFQAFKQRYVMGWVGAGEKDKAVAAASRLWVFDDPDTKVGEFGQTDLTGYLESREATLQNMATISQTPPHMLLGKMINLSAEALAAAEAGQQRKVGQRETGMGESWEQVFELCGLAMGEDVADSAQVRWRDTEARSLASTVDALGKMAQMLGVPPEMLWEKIPGWTQQDVERARKLASEADSVGSLAALLDRAMGGGPGGDESGGAVGGGAA